MYEVACVNCGEAIVSPAVEGVCVCGQAYRFEWQASYHPSAMPPPPSLENGDANT
jgi:hypothetical protein